MADTGNIGALLGKLGHWQTRHAARTALAALGPTAAAGDVLRLVQNSEAAENARWAAIALLAEWKYAPANSVLLGFLKNEPRLRGEACRALQAITGQEIGEDAAAWERFFTGTEGTAAEASAAETGRGDNANFSLVQEAVKDVVQELSWEAPGYAYVRCPCHDGRKQQVVVYFQDDAKSGSMIVVYTESGAKSAAATDAVSRRNATIRHGAMFRLEKNSEGGEAVTCRCSIPRCQATAEMLREIILYLAQEADSLEYELHGADHV